ncbi:MAG: branched-chain amino acid transport system permease protein [Frankiaceae bacterium]|jgi:ABC-type branched-subunit amino acid transport system permease subunit|nr:branched-chain amino acid transport system permease protein [Frankiaceae bacterium]
MNRGILASPGFRRLLACLAGSLVGALMIGPQEGVQEDYGYAFRKAILAPRVFVFLAVGLLAWVLITFWGRITPYFSRPGATGLWVGLVTVLAGQTLLKWDDQIGTGKFGEVATAATRTPQLSPLTRAFFGFLHWTALVLVLVLGFYAIAQRVKPLAWVTAVLSVAFGAVAFAAHANVIGFTHHRDHSFGAFATLVGYLVVAVGCGAAALSREQVAGARASVDRALAWRPGFPLVATGALATLLAFTLAAWFAPHTRNTNLAASSALFSGSGITSLTAAYLQWLGWVLFAVTAIVAVYGSYRRNALASRIALGTGVVGVLLTLETLYDISKVGANAGVDQASGPWQNLGIGGWVACAGLSLLAAGCSVALTGLRLANPRTRSTPDGVTVPRPGASETPMGLSLRNASGTTKTVLLVGLIVAVFFPPTMTEFWQKVLVSEIGVYVLLAIGLNVVVGWAGLLDLGFIAFYAIGSYTTAYLVGSLPHKPPSWLHMPPLAAIPFAIGICLLAGLALGAPTLRLRGDYLAIVTLGFGEIIRITAVNNPGNITNSTRGPSPAVPHPVIHLGPLHITWGLNNLQYWYLLLVIIILVVVLFYRLEGSRLGRAWAAIREDEVAAQASGVNTTRVKLMAFAIGASTSGVAGVFFASQIGYFNPDNFVLNNSILVVAYVVFGGMGSLPGAIAGAAVLTWLPEFLKDQVPADDRQMWIGALVLLMMIFRPAGLVPARRRKAELTGLGSPISSESRAVPASEGL